MSATQPHTRTKPALCAAAILAATLLLLWPAVWNGWPLIFSDTMDYVSLGVSPGLRTIRPPAYGWLIAPLHQGVTLWPVIAAQALLTAWLLHLTLRANGSGAGGYLGVAALLAAATGASWFASWVMADALTAPMILAGVLLATAPLGWLTRLGVWCAFAASAAVHVTHLPVVMAMVAALALFRLTRPAAPVRWDGLALMLAAIPAALAGNIGANWLSTGTAALSFGSSLFLGARLIGDGLMQAHLAQVCPDAAITLCADLAALPRDSDAFLWDPTSPVWRTQDFFLLEAELAALNPEVIAAHWPAFLINGARRGLAQLFRAEVGTDLTPHVARSVTIRFGQLLGQEAEAGLAAARQTREYLAQAWPARAAGPLSLAALLCLCLVALIRPGLLRGHAGALAVAVVAAAVANAFTVGLLGAVHDRYQARLAWLFPLALLLLLRPHFYQARRTPSHRSGSEERA